MQPNINRMAFAVKKQTNKKQPHKSMQSQQENIARKSEHVFKTIN